MLTNPLYLLALTGLSVPIAIHLLSRKEGKIIKLGSVRHVVETSTQQFKGIKLNEIILLTLRCSMIIVFSLLLSGLQCSSPGKEKWVIVEKELGGLPNLNSVLDSLENEDYSLRLMASGYPALKDSSQSYAEVNYWQFVADLKQKNLAEAIVFSRNDINHFKGMRSGLPSNVRWISQPLPSIDFPVNALWLSNDSVSLLTGHSAADKTYFTTEKIHAKASPVAATSRDTINIMIASDPDFSFDQKIIKAALFAIKKTFAAKIVLTESGSSNAVTTPADWCIWLSSEKVDVRNAKRTIRFDPQVSNELIVQTEPDQWVITKRLNQEIALRNDLTMGLAVLLLPEKDLEQKINSHDRRIVADSLAWGRLEGAKEIQASIHYESAGRYLILLLLAILLVERILAYKRNQ